MRAGRWALSIALGTFAAGTIQAQEEGQAVIRQVGGQHLYLDLAQASALQAADTLALEDGAATEHLLLVVAVDSMRAVVTFAGEPFSLTRGSTITFTVRRGTNTGLSPAVAAAPSSPSPPTAVSIPAASSSACRASAVAICLNRVWRRRSIPRVSVLSQGVTWTILIRAALAPFAIFAARPVRRRRMR